MIFVSSLLTLFFCFAATVKLTARPTAIFAVQQQYFQSYGLGRWHMRVIGLTELTGALLLWSSWPWLGASLLLLTSVGAIGFHLRFDSAKEGLPAMVTASLSLLLLVVS